ncbi:RGCVC family protein [Modestobacter marinus]|uniref:RGCVC family protein n=1 Tax=Modestobacter marinus TaxID=477641 RepID=UPI001C98CE88|nr:RGCVC family protein [Modestobacter marinus]
MPAPASTAPRTGQHDRRPEATPESGTAPGCDVCPHRVADHDAISLRFCRATRDSVTAQGCVCQPA